MHTFSGDRREKAQSATMLDFSMVFTENTKVVGWMFVYRLVSCHGVAGCKCIAVLE